MDRLLFQSFPQRFQSPVLLRVSRPHPFSVSSDGGEDFGVEPVEVLLEGGAASLDARLQRGELLRIEVHLLETHLDVVKKRVLVEKSRQTEARVRLGKLDGGLGLGGNLVRDGVRHLGELFLRVRAVEPSG